MEPNLHKRHYVINHYKINTLRFADDKAQIADLEDNLQRGVFTLQNIANILEWITNVYKEYIGCEISYVNEKDIQQKLAKFVQLQGILNNTFKPTLNPEIF